MKNNERQNLVRQRKYRRERAKQIKIFITIVGIAVILLFVYLMWSVFSLIIESVDLHSCSEFQSNTSLASISEYGTDINKYEIDTKSKEKMKEEYRKILKNSTIPISDIVMEEVITFAMENNISINDYPVELLELLQKNPETKEFVLKYPLKKGEVSHESLSLLMDETKRGIKNIEDMPLLMQWDERWGYYQYGDNVMGLTGCGPTCLSMVASYLLGDADLTPLYMADYSLRNGYCVEGFGSSWELMSEGAEDLGLGVCEVPLSENVVKQYLESGNPIICIVGEGDFTDNGHFIVFKGWKDGKILINDSNSREKTEKLWSFEDIKYQIKNMWAYRVE